MPEIPGARLAGGLWCHEVLENLDAWVDGSLPDEVKAMAQAHLEACDHCTRFGGAYARVVTGLRAGLGFAAVEPGVADRLAARLRAALEE